MTSNVNADTRNMVNKEKDFLGQLVDFYSDSNAQRIQNLKDTLGNISSLTQSNDSTLFAIGKAAALAQATIDGIAAVQKALAAAPPPFNFILAGLVGAAQAVNLSKIASAQPPKFADGGIVPGSSFTGDRVMARLNSREAVLTLQDQKDLFSAIRGGGLGGGSSMSVIIQGNVVANDEEQANRLLKRIEGVLLYRSSGSRLQGAF